MTHATQAPGPSRAVVVGAGVAGMSAALLLRSLGIDATLVEKSPRTAPLLRGFEREGVHFDTGFHCAGGLRRGGLLRIWLKVLGLDLPFGTWTPVVETLCTEGRMIPMEFPAAARAGTPARDGGPGSEDLLAAAVAEGLAKSPFTCPEQSEMAGLLSLEATPLDRVLCGFGLPPDVMRILKARAVLYGVQPCEAAWENFLLVAGPYLDGCGTLPGGGKTFATAFDTALASSGVRILTGRAAVRILTGVNGRADAVVLDDGRTIPCDCVVFTGHPGALPPMLGPGLLRPAWTRHVQGMRETGMPFVLYGIADRNVEPHHAWYVLHDTDRFSLLGCPEPDFCVMTGGDRGGRKALSVMAMHGGVPAGADRAEWRAVASDALSDAVRRALPELEGRWRPVCCSDDATMRRWVHGSTGSLYGVSHDAGQLPLPPATRIGNLVMAGQNIILPGMLGCIISAAVAVSIAAGGHELLERFRQCAEEELS